VSGKLLLTGFFIEALTESHDRTAFSCGINELDRYFGNQIGQDVRRKVAAPFVLIDESSGAIAGFYTLTMKSVGVTEMPVATQKKLPRYPDVPAVLLGRMGVDVNYKGRGLGEALLFDALKRAYETSRDVAAFAVVVDAKHGAENFYLKYGFMPFSDQENRLFLPMVTIEKLVSG
jgi:predicted GNAT family N-acyltransferase